MGRLVSFTCFPTASTIQWSPSRSAGRGRGVATVNGAPVRVGISPFCPDSVRAGGGTVVVTRLLLAREECAPAPMDISDFHPLVARWFTATLVAPPPAQTDVWTAMAGARDRLL